MAEAATAPIEAWCIQQSQPLLQEFIRKHNIPHKKVGAIMIAWNQDEVQLFYGFPTYISSSINPFSPHDALKHHFTSLKTYLIFSQLRVLEDKFR